MSGWLVKINCQMSGKLININGEIRYLITNMLSKLKQKFVQLNVLSNTLIIVFL